MIKASRKIILNMLHSLNKQNYSLKIVLFQQDGYITTHPGIIKHN